MFSIGHRCPILDTQNAVEFMFGGGCVFGRRSVVCIINFA